MMGHHESVDYAEEGRKLLARVNLLEENENPQPSTARRRYSPASAIFKHPDTGATVYVGNYMAAGSMDQLNSLQTCRRIVFCQDRDGEKHFESNPEFQYLTFPIGRWRTLIANRTPESVAAFFQPLFEFLEAELGQGNSILIHCLAGAHRAGTAGIASLMHLTGMDAKDATKAAQALRPAINPIGDFPTLLYLLEMGMKKKNSE
jgi:hypothetical protein